MGKTPKICHAVLHVTAILERVRASNLPQKEHGLLQLPTAYWMILPYGLTT